MFASQAHYMEWTYFMVAGRFPANLTNSESPANNTVVSWKHKLTFFIYEILKLHETETSDKSKMSKRAPRGGAVGHPPPNLIKGGIPPLRRPSPTGGGAEVLNRGLYSSKYNEFSLKFEEKKRPPRNFF